MISVYIIRNTEDIISLIKNLLQINLVLDKHLVLPRDLPVI